MQNVKTPGVFFYFLILRFCQIWKLICNSSGMRQRICKWICKRRLPWKPNSHLLSQSRCAHTRRLQRGGGMCANTTTPPPPRGSQALQALLAQGSSGHQHCHGHPRGSHGPETGLWPITPERLVHSGVLKRSQGRPKVPQGTVTGTQGALMALQEPAFDLQSDTGVTGPRGAKESGLSFLAWLLLGLSPGLVGVSSQPLPRCQKQAWRLVF